MPIEMRTHGLDWRKKLRENHAFVALCTPAWQRDTRCQRQLAYARELGLPIYLLVRAGATPHPTIQRGEHVAYYTSVEDAATLLTEIVEGQR